MRRIAVSQVFRFPAKCILARSGEVLKLIYWEI